MYKRAATAGLRAGQFLVVQAWVFCSLIILYAVITIPGFQTGRAVGVACWRLRLLWLLLHLQSGCGIGEYQRSHLLAEFHRDRAASNRLFRGTLTLAREDGRPPTGVIRHWLLPGGHKVNQQTTNTRPRSLVQALLGTLAFAAGTFFQTVVLVSVVDFAAIGVLAAS